MDTEVTRCRAADELIDRLDLVPHPPKVRHGPALATGAVASDNRSAASDRL